MEEMQDDTNADDDDSGGDGFINPDEDGTL
jgi:hypothetical protein